MKSNTVSVWPSCPQCQSENTDWETWSPQANDIARLYWECNDCGHEWSLDVDKDDPITEAYDVPDDDEYEDDEIEPMPNFGWDDFLGL